MLLCLLWSVQAFLKLFLAFGQVIRGQLAFGQVITAVQTQAVMYLIKTLKI